MLHILIAFNCKTHHFTRENKEDICLNVFHMVNPVCLPCTVKDHMLLQIPSFHTVSQLNCIGCHVSENIVYSQILSQIHSYHGGKVSKQGKK